MKKKILFFSLLLLINNLLLCQIINKEPLSLRITGYSIDAVLDIRTKSVSGYMESFWVNKSEDKVTEVHLHMYMNGFKSRRTTFYREATQSPWMISSCDGWINIDSCTDRNGHDLLPFMKYISPDDGNLNDSTVLKIILPRAANPGDTVHFKMKFVTRLPSSIIRTGYNDDFYFVAQWFPKFGVYEPAGMRYRETCGWNCHQYHANSEFYSDHSVYNVRITIPEEFKAGSCGVLTDEIRIDSAKKILTYRAEDIVDFAWTAWPGYSVFTDQWNHVGITLLIPSKRISQVNRQFSAVANALEFFSENVGPFPWNHLTIVDPPVKGMGAGGMEYTTMFTSASADKIPGWVHKPEMVTVHEFGHAYFMGIIATNEFEEPWMDEGMNSFFEARIMDHFWGENSGIIDHPGLKVSGKYLSRSGYVRSEYRQVATNNEYSWNYPLNTYEIMSYNKAATWLYTLMGIVGEETTNEIFREYYRKWAFKHPAGRDFINIVNDIVTRDHGDIFGKDMNWFFEQTLYGSGICDYMVAGFRNRKFENSDSLYNSSVSLQRIGDVILPVEVLVHFSNGDEVIETWDGVSRYKELNFTGYRKIDHVKIDPDHKIRMDVNFINNSMTEDPNRLPLRRFMVKLISFMQIIISAFAI